MQIFPVFRTLAFAFLLLTILSITSPIIALETLHEGSWTKKAYAIDGTWKIIQDGDRFFVLLDARFSTKKAPDLKIFLSPLSLAEISNKNATENSTLVGPLQSHRGAQRLEIPTGTDLTRFKTLIVHCEKYSKLWGGAELS